MLMQNVQTGEKILALRYSESITYIFLQQKIIWKAQDMALHQMDRRLSQRHSASYLQAKQ